MSAGPESADVLGANVRQRRLALGLTLDQLAEQSGVSAAMLSEVERSMKNPTVRLAYQIARALRCSLTDLLEPREGRPASLVRAGDRRALLDPESGVARYALSPDLLERGIELVNYELPAGASVGAMTPNRRGILEHVTVTRGRLLLCLGGDQGESFDLEVGDGLTYGPQVTVEYRNAGRGSCAFFLVSDSSRAL